MRSRAYSLGSQLRGFSLRLRGAIKQTEGFIERTEKNLTCRWKKNNKFVSPPPYIAGPPLRILSRYLIIR